MSNQDFKLVCNLNHKIVGLLAILGVVTNLWSGWYRVDEGVGYGVVLRKIEGVDLTDELPLWVQGKLSFSPESSVVLDWSYFENGWFVLTSHKAHSTDLWRVEKDQDYKLEIKNVTALFTNGTEMGIVQSTSPESESSILKIGKDAKGKYSSQFELYRSSGGILAAAFMGNSPDLVVLYMGFIEIISKTNDPMVKEVKMSNGSLESLSTIVALKSGDLIVAGDAGVFEIRKGDNFSLLRELKSVTTK